MKGAQGASGFWSCSVSWSGTGHMGVFSLWRLIKLYTYDVCTFLYVCSNSVTTFLKSCIRRGAQRVLKQLWIIWHLYNVLKFSGGKKTIIVYKRKNILENCPPYLSIIADVSSTMLCLVWKFESQSVIMVLNPPIEIQK